MNSRIPETPPDIIPLNAQLPDKQPFWSVMIPVFNCSRFLPENLQSVLQQALPPGDMQIEVVDDASTDANVAQLVKYIGKDRISYYRQSCNVGSLRNFETCINRAKGKYVHLLHGDDIILNGFYEKMGDLLKKHSDAGAAFCRYNYINESGETLYASELEMQVAGLLDNWLERIATRQRIQTPAMVVKRTTYEKLGSFYAVHYGEDWEMWVRIAACFPVVYHPEILAAYRQHRHSITGQYFLTAQNIRDLKKVMNIIAGYLPKEKEKEIRRNAEKFYSHYAINTARMLWHHTQNTAAVKAQVKEATSLHKDFEVIKQSLKLKIKMAFRIP